MQNHTRPLLQLPVIKWYLLAGRDMGVVKPLEAARKALKRPKADDVWEFEIRLTSSGASDDDKKPTVECSDLNGRDDNGLGLDVMVDVR